MTHRFASPRQPVCLHSVMLWAAALICGLRTPAAGTAAQAAALRALTGCRTRVVWVQDIGDGRDVFCQGNRLLLMGIDSDDGKGERPIIGTPGSVAKPLITPRGDRVAFTDRRRGKVCIIGFDGAGRRDIADGALADVWQDPETGLEWVLVGQAPRQQRGDGVFGRIVRIGIDRPWDRQTVWTNAPGQLDNFQVSADGTHASGLFPWPHCGVADLRKRTWRKLGSGCWPSLAPDNSYLFWVFDGPHRNVYMHANGNARQWKVSINSAPGIGGFEVYHPRWSNHPRFMAMTGPYKVGKGGNKIGGGGAEVEVYLGRFNPGRTRVEQWVRVSHNRRADFYPDAWVEPVAGKTRAANSAPAGAASAGPPAATRGRGAAPPWPGSAAGLVFAWENNNATNLIVPPRGGAQRSCRVTAVGSAYFGRFYDMVLAHGACVAEGVDRELLEACRQTNELTVEAALTPANVTQGGPARIVTFSNDPGSRNFTLGQERGKLIFRLRTPRTGTNGTNPQTTFGRLRPGRMTHVVVTYRPGLLRAYQDGKKVVETKAVQGDFRNWTAQHLLFGDEWTRDRDWAGRLEGICVFNRFLSDKEARARYELHRARVAGRRPIARLKVRCRLLEVTPVPDPRTLQQYSRGLVVYCYEIRKVLEGREPGRKVLVAHWGVLDRRVVKTIRQRKPGQEVVLTVERFADHPELESERRFNDCEDLDLPLYYDVSTPGPNGAR